MTQRALHVAQILWPAFLFAAVLEGLVFAWIDPTQVSIGRWQPDATTVYSVTFLVFWCGISLAGALSVWLMLVGTEPRRRPARTHRSGQALSRSV
ncbi:hypothetical protein [uncultured Aquabacterium sp.]|uniref:hypothetical protein n=1 Tax=Aquabacterium sp. TaxID=1872578 RepID=UPI0025CE453E|nr:hypothetical protein [uncultured Aquabacterium sp.]